MRKISGKGDKREMNEITEENTKNEQKVIGIKLPWWIGYTILIIIIAASFFLIYKAFTNYESVETVAKIESPVFTVNINKNIIEVGEKIEVEVTKYKENVILESSNPEIIKVEGKSIIGVSEGEAIIYATYNDEKSNELSLKCVVNLNKIILDKTELEVLINEEEKITATLVPENATYKELNWESSDESIATVQNGLIKGNKEGKATITVTEINTNKKASCSIIVKPIEVNGISLDETNVNIGVGQKYILKETITPENATNKNITWSSSNKSVISVQEGEIKALAVGDATVKIVSTNGKTASCKFHVTQAAPTNKKRYVTNSFNVRIGPGTNYKLLATVQRNDEIEVLNETNDYAKIRLSNGIVGYTVLKSYSSSRTYYIENVPFINQFNLGYPTGCEAVAATMAARYSGYNVSSATIIANTPTDTKGKRQETRTKEIKEDVLNEETGEMETIITTTEETVWVGENPFKYFVGHPSKGKSTGSYGCFAVPIVTALRNSGVSCTDISGCSIDTVFGYIEKGKPVIIWCRANAADLTAGVTWKYPDGSGEFSELVGEHCAVLIGYDGDYVYLNDPAVGKGVKQPKGKFIRNWQKLYSQAIIIN